jgi:subtilase family serine protease
MVTKDARNIHEIKSRTAMTKAAFNKKKILSTSKLDLNFRRKLDLEYSFVWSWERMEIS